MNWIMLIVGLFLLIKGSDWFVDGASDVARLLKVSPLVIGLTIVAFGTSAPEAAVSISASIKGTAGVAIGNVVGSNIFNLLMVVGISACIKVLMVDKLVISRDFPFNLLATLAVIFVGLDRVIDHTKTVLISRTDGLLLLCLFAVFMYYMVSGALKDRENISPVVPSRHLAMSITFLLVGIVAVVSGGQLTVDGACGIARSFGVSENLIALTIIAIGTSLPELVTSVTALKKGEDNIAIGNVIGSNIFNLLFILGLSASIRSLRVDTASLIDSVLLLAVSALVFVLFLKNKSVGRRTGVLMILLYSAFSVYIVMRGIV